VDIPMLHVAAALYTDALIHADEAPFTPTTPTTPAQRLPWLEPAETKIENENGLPPKEEPAST
jgi:hypothetical protein